MSELSIYLFDDAVSAAWEPFALTRPAGELRFGALTMRERASRVLGGSVRGHLGPEHLRGFAEPGAAAVLAYAEAPADGDRLFLAARAVPAWGAPRPSAAGPVFMEGETVGWFAPAGSPPPPPEWFPAPAAAAGGTELRGRLLRHVWELMAATPAQVAADVAALFPAGGGEAPLPAGVHRSGEHPLVLGAGVRLEPTVVIDTTSGPVWLDDGVQVRALTRLAGPLYVGRGTQLLGGWVEAASIGETCRIRGEFAASVCLGWVNKAHDGHIGHAYLGAWVNLGAGTTNSDLKNNYGTVKLWTPAGAVDTGEMKVGCFLGDHVKTGICLPLNTGTVVGAGSNLFGGVMPPTHVPPFSWGTGGELSAYRVDRFLETAERAMARRSVELTGPMRRQLEAAWRRGRPELPPP